MKSTKTGQYVLEIQRIMGLFGRYFHIVAASGVKAGITIPQLLVLQFLQQNNNSKMSDLSEALEVTMGNVTTLVDRMIRVGYVARFDDSFDRRVVRVKITAKGKQIFNEMLKIKRQRLVKILKQIPQKDIRTVIKVMKKIVNLIKDERG